MLWKLGCALYCYFISGLEGPSTPTSPGLLLASSVVTNGCWDSWEWEYLRISGVKLAYTSSRWKRAGVWCALFRGVFERFVPSTEQSESWWCCCGLCHVSASTTSSRPCRWQCGRLQVGSKVLRPTRHKIGRFRDIVPSQSLGSVLKKPNPTKLTVSTKPK